MHRYTPEQHEFIQEIAPGRRIKEIRALFAERFGVELTLSAVKSYLQNHKITTGTYRKYTQEHIEWLRENVIGTRFRDLTQTFNERFGFDISVTAMVALCDKHGLHNGIDRRFNPAFTESGKTHRFKKGHIPANKGIKGISHPGSKATQFKKGHRPHNYMPVGSERINANGYAEVKVADPKTWKLKHVLIWEAANGPVPKGHAVIFGDGNKKNLDPENLLLVARAQLARLNQNGLIGKSAELTRTGILVADIIGKIAERQRGEKRTKG